MHAYHACMSCVQASARTYLHCKWNLARDYNFCSLATVDSNSYAKEL